VISAANLTNDPSAKQLRLSEETVFDKLFTEGYHDILQLARKRFADFSQNREFNEIMRELKKNPNLARTRLLNPKNPDGTRQTFYHRAILEELAKHYNPR
jgi:hypothetical protein